MLADQPTLRRYFARRPCKACQQCRPPEAVLVLAHRQHTVMVLVTCGECHQRGIYVVSLPTPRFAPVTLHDVSDMRRFLATFNGDFLALFGGNPHGQLAGE